MSDLFSDQDAPGYQPLAARMRPATLSEYEGQLHILGKDKPLYKALSFGKPHSMILWGPPGTGKTTLAQLVATVCNARFIPLSAVLSGTKEIREAIEIARYEKQRQKPPSILFVDEAHRFNKAQQDVFLPHVESGLVVFIGATTENPGFALNSALLSRSRTYKLKPLDRHSLKRLLDRTIKSEKGLGAFELTITSEAIDLLLDMADGDARRLLNALEIAADFSENKTIDAASVKEVVDNAPKRFDKHGDIHYDYLSAFHKSVRGSSPDAALYWSAQFIESGGDPQLIFRRLTAIASEDIGNADPRALSLVISAWQAFERLGVPEGLLSLSHAITYCACAAKSNAVYLAMNAAFDNVRQSPSPEVPLHLRNAPLDLMKKMGYGKEYRYAHNEPGAYAAGESYFPDNIPDQRYYVPNERGMEIKIKQKLEWLQALDKTAVNKRKKE